MSKPVLSYALILITSIILLPACSSIPTRQHREMTNLYQHYWVNTSKPHADQDINSVAKYLADFDVIFFGELHAHAAVHLAQMQLFEAMYRLNPKLGLSLEQFERDVQPYIDDYIAGKIGEKHLISKTRAWDNYPTSYRPLVEFAREKKLSVIAANAPKKTVICVGRKGLDYLDVLTPEDRQYIAADIDISDGSYRQKFMSFITNNASHGSTSDNKMSDMMKKMSERSYAAQVVRDDTMAESIALHLQKNPEIQLLHLNGIFHSSNYLGIVERLGRRMPELKIAVIETVTLAPNKQNQVINNLKNGNLLLLVKHLPIGFVDKDNELEWSKAILKKRKKSGDKCVMPAQLPPGE